MITVADDDWVRCHPDAQAAIRDAVPGARVRFWEPPLRDSSQNVSERSRCYEITVRRFGAPDVCVRGTYALPAHAGDLCSSAIKQVAQATGETR